MNKNMNKSTSKSKNNFTNIILMVQLLRKLFSCFLYSSIYIFLNITFGVVGYGKLRFIFNKLENKNKLKQIYNKFFAFGKKLINFSLEDLSSNNKISENSNESVFTSILNEKYTVIFFLLLFIIICALSDEPIFYDIVHCEIETRFGSTAVIIFILIVSIFIFFMFLNFFVPMSYSIKLTIFIFLIVVLSLFLYFKSNAFNLFELYSLYTFITVLSIFFLCFLIDKYSYSELCFFSVFSFSILFLLFYYFFLDFNYCSSKLVFFDDSYDPNYTIFNIDNFACRLYKASCPKTIFSAFDSVNIYNNNNNNNNNYNKLFLYESDSVDIIISGFESNWYSIGDLSSKNITNESLLDFCLNSHFDPFVGPTLRFSSAEEYFRRSKSILFTDYSTVDPLYTALSIVRSNNLTGPNYYFDIYFTDLNSKETNIGIISYIESFISFIGTYVALDPKHEAYSKFYRNEVSRMDDSFSDPCSFNIISINTSHNPPISSDIIFLIVSIFSTIKSVMNEFLPNSSLGLDSDSIETYSVDLSFNEIEKYRASFGLELYLDPITFRVRTKYGYFSDIFINNYEFNNLNSIGNLLFANAPINDLYFLTRSNVGVNLINEYLNNFFNIKSKSYPYLYTDFLFFTFKNIDLSFLTNHINMGQHFLFDYTNLPSLFIYSYELESKVPRFLVFNFSLFNFWFTLGFDNISLWFILLNDIFISFYCFI